jgi:hypothetical protein
MRNKDINSFSSPSGKVLNSQMVWDVTLCLYFNENSKYNNILLQLFSDVIIRQTLSPLDVSEKRKPCQSSGRTDGS